MILAEGTPAISFPNIDYVGLLPLLIVLGVACIGILVEGFLPRALRFRVQVPLTLLGLVGGFVAVLMNINKSAPVFTPSDGDGSRIDAVVIDGPGVFLMGTIVLLGIVAVLLIAERRVAAGGAFVAHAAVAADSSEDAKQAAEPGATEVFPLTLFSIGGMMLFVTAGDLLTLFVALEVFSLPLYLLCGLARRRRLLSQESAMKYFLLGAFASAFFVYGVALLYGFAGSVQLVDINAAVANSDNADVLLLGGLAMLAVGLLFKAAAVPFHVWTPDVYTGAPTPITALMAACTKVAAFGGLLRVFNVAFGGSGDGATSLEWEWRPLLTAVAIATMVIGAIMAVTQTDIKRLLAYSSIANAGYLLVGVIALDKAIGATMFYLVAYGFTVLAAFAIVTLVRDSDGEATHLSRWAGLAKRSPRFAVIFTLLMLGFAGIPLTSGFAGKFAVFSSALQADQIALVVVGVLTSVVLAFPYLKVVVLLWLSQPVEDAPSVSLPSFATGAAVAAGVIVTVLLGVAPQLVLDMVSDAGMFLAK